MKMRLLTAYFRWLQKYYLRHDAWFESIRAKVLHNSFRLLEDGFDVWIKYQDICLALSIEPYDIAARTLCTRSLFTSEMIFCQRETKQTVNS